MDNAARRLNERSESVTRSELQGIVDDLCEGVAEMLREGRAVRRFGVVLRPDGTVALC
jgi:hypothetical protein